MSSGVKHDPPWQPPKKLVIPKTNGKPWEIGTVRSVEKVGRYTEIVLRFDDYSHEQLQEWLGEDLWLQLAEEK